MGVAPKGIFPRTCVALGLPDPAKLMEHARREAQNGESFLEFRLDYLDRPESGLAVIRNFLKDHPECMLLATCRRHQNHGKFNGSVDEQLNVLNQAIQAGARAVDMEIESAEAVSEKLTSLRGRAHLVISYHNYQSTPQLDPVLRRMARIPADAYKIVTTARKPSDNARVLGLARENPRTPMIVLAMGETGFPTRVLSPASGSLFTYAAPLAAEGTAAGQVSARQLRHLYRIDKISRSTKVFGVIGDPLRHSISPAVHNRGFQSRHIDATYLPFLVSPLHLGDFFVLAERVPIAGFSVTIPHKQKVMRYLDVVDPLARRIGAVNTVWRKAGKWRGANTDAAGVLVPLSRLLRPARSSVLIVGNGGAARGAACALVDAGAKVSITGRNPDRVRALSRLCGAEPVSRDDSSRRHFDALVHATPIGMFPHVEECFFPDGIPAEIVFDMVYNPLETVLIRRAREQGKAAVPGLDMFIEQAVRQFEIFTGENPPRQVMEKAAMEALAHKS